MGRALRLIGVRARTESELASRLIRGGAPDAVAEDVCRRLKELGYLDDGEFAQQWVEERISLRPVGRKVLLGELLRKGVPRETAERSIADYDQHAEFAAACRLLARQWQRSAGVEPAERLRRCYRYLLGRGFNYQTSSAAVQRLQSEAESGSDGTGRE